MWHEHDGIQRDEYAGHIIAELRDNDNKPIIKARRLACGEMRSLLHPGSPTATTTSTSIAEIILYRFPTNSFCPPNRRRITTPSSRPHRTPFHSFNHSLAFSTHKPLVVPHHNRRRRRRRSSSFARSLARCPLGLGRELGRAGGGSRHHWAHACQGHRAAQHPPHLRRPSRL